MHKTSASLRNCSTQCKTFLRVTQPLRAGDTTHQDEQQQRVTWKQCHHHHLKPIGPRVGGRGAVQYQCSIHCTLLATPWHEDSMPESQLQNKVLAAYASLCRSPPDRGPNLAKLTYSQPSIALSNLISALYSFVLKSLYLGMRNK